MRNELVFAPERKERQYVSYSSTGEGVVDAANASVKFWFDEWVGMMPSRCFGTATLSSMGDFTFQGMTRRQFVNMLKENGLKLQKIESPKKKPKAKRRKPLAKDGKVCVTGTADGAVQVTIKMFKRNTEDMWNDLIDELYRAIDMVEGLEEAEYYSEEGLV